MCPIDSKFQLQKCDFRLKHTMRETDCYVTHWSQSLDEVPLNCSNESYPSWFKPGLEMNN